MSAKDHTRIIPPKFPGSHAVWTPFLVDGLIVGEIKSRADDLDVSSVPIPNYLGHKYHS